MLNHTIGVSTDSGTDSEQSTTAQPEQPAKHRRPWEEETVAFEAWKHHAATGGHDKDRMVTIATWLLGASAVIAFTVVRGIDGYQLTQPITTGALAITGMFASFLAGVTTLLYGGYANWRWATADEIAKAYDWHYLLITHTPFSTSSERGDFIVEDARNLLARWITHPLQEFTRLALRMARPRRTDEQIAPVFWIFACIAAVSFVIHLLVLIWATLIAFGSIQSRMPLDASMGSGTPTPTPTSAEHLGRLNSSFPFVGSHESRVQQLDRGTSMMPPTAFITFVDPTRPSLAPGGANWSCLMHSSLLPTNSILSICPINLIAYDPILRGAGGEGTDV